MLNPAYIFRVFKGLFLVTACPVCGKMTDMGGMCESCLKIIDNSRITDGTVFIDGVKGEGIFSYECEQVKSAVKYMKKAPDDDVFGYFSALTAGKIRTFGLSEDTVITFVPRSSAGLRENGFDQSEYLAKKTAKILGFPTVKILIKRAGKSKAQKTLPGKDRAENVKGMFRAVNRKNSYKNIVIVDDVLTTGASMKECISVLKNRYPCAEIYFVTLAKRNGDSKMMIPERK